MSFMSCY